MLCNEKINAFFIPDIDPYTEKPKLAEIMGLHRNTIGKWHKWAKMIVFDYRSRSRISLCIAYSPSHRLQNKLTVVSGILTFLLVATKEESLNQWILEQSLVTPVFFDPCQQKRTG